MKAFDVLPRHLQVYCRLHLPDTPRFKRRVEIIAEGRKTRRSRPSYRYWWKFYRRNELRKRPLAKSRKI